MKYDTESHSLHFASPAEASQLRLQLTDLLREAVGAAQGETADVAAATARSRTVMKRFNTVMRTLNTLRLAGVGAADEGDPSTMT